MDIFQLLTIVKAREASDLHISAGSPPLIRVNGDLTHIDHLAPLTIEDALALISRLRGQKIFDGFRGEPPVNREELAGTLVALGNIGLQYPRIHEIDVNPLIVGKKGVMVAIDATIVLR